MAPDKKIPAGSVLQAPAKKENVSLHCNQQLWRRFSIDQRSLTIGGDEELMEKDQPRTSSVCARV